MRKIWNFLFLIILLFGCKNNSTPECNCCEITYENFNDAIECIKENPKESSYDNRLFLLAFSNESNKNNWNIINDDEIISIAKRNYILITLAESESEFLNKNGTPELLGIIQKHKNEKLFFVVVNQALYPFADWNDREQKEIIIDRLKIGNGP